MNTIEVDAAVKEFDEIAERYCAWAESLLGGSDEEMLTARKLLAELHPAAIYLPDLGSSENVEVAVPADKWKVVCRHFYQLPINNYWDVFNPLEQEAPVLNSLFDDLT